MLDEPDTIDRLNNIPTPCSIITGDYSTLLIELAPGIVQPGDKKCHTKPVRDGYVMVKLAYFHDNTKDVALPIPLPDADIYTLGDVLVLCNVTNKIRKRTDTTVAFTQEYSRLSYPLRNVSKLSMDSDSSKDTHVGVEKTEERTFYI